MNDSDEFTIKRITGNFSMSDDVVLDETPTTCLIFRPKVHNGGVRGELIRFKKEQGKLIEPERINFTNLNLNEGTYLQLNTASITKIVKRVHDLYLANQLLSPWRRQEGFRVAPVDAVIDDTNKEKIIKQLLEKGYSDDFWNELVVSDPDLATRLSWAKIYEGYETVLQEFKNSIVDKPDDEAYWQSFFELHPWILQQAFSYPVLFLEGDVYVGGKKSKSRQGMGGVATDFLFTNESSRSFAVAEIKTPNTHLVGSIYRGNEGSGDANEVYSMHSSLSGSLVQTQNQIKTASSQFSNVLKETFGDDMNATHPHGILVIGTLESLNEQKARSFNHFRFAIKDITIITYDELLKRSEAIFKQTNISNEDNSESIQDENIAIDTEYIEDLPF